MNDFPDLNDDGKVTRADILKGRGVFKRGGKVKHEDIKKDMPMMAKVAAKAVKGHEKRMHKMAKGGVTGEAMRKYGRNMARVMNQRGSSRSK